MYTISSLFKLAIKIEEDGYNFYTNLKKNNDKEYLNILLDKFINDEQNHKKIFEDLNNKIPHNTSPIEIKEKLKKQIDYFKSNLIFNTNNSKFDAIKLINIAIEVELASISYYNEVKKLVEIKYRSILDYIIKEEKNHLTELIKIKNKYTNLKINKKEVIKK